MAFHYGFSAMLILSGAMCAWIGPDVCGEQPDGTPGPVAPHLRPWVRALGVTCVGAGFLFLGITVLGLWGPGAPGPPTP
jgi:hypothetical protein